MTTLRFRYDVAVMALVIWACFPGSLLAQNCQLDEVFKGKTLISKAAIPLHDGFGGYAYYLVLNDDRSAGGILNDYIKATLVPERWGLDVRSPSGVLLGQINTRLSDPALPKDLIEISSHEDGCAHVFLRRTGKSKLDFILERNIAGSVYNAYSETFE